MIQKNTWLCHLISLYPTISNYILLDFLKFLLDSQNQNTGETLKSTEDPKTLMLAAVVGQFAPLLNQMQKALNGLSEKSEKNEKTDVVTKYHQELPVWRGFLKSVQESGGNNAVVESLANQLQALITAVEQIKSSLLQSNETFNQALVNAKQTVKTLADTTQSMHTKSVVASGGVSSGR